MKCREEIPMFKVTMNPMIGDIVTPVLKSGWIGQGPKVAEFETLLWKKFDNPNVLTLSAGTHGLSLALRLAGVKQGDEVITTPLTCLSYISSIETDKGFIPIGKIVNQKLNVKVKSLNQETGEIEWKKVTNWIKLPSDNVEWYNLFLENGNSSRSKLGKRSLWITGDHKVLTDHGWKRVDELQSNNFKIATDNKKPNKKQMEFINGTMLGDGCIQRHNSSARLTFGHCNKQIEWVDYKEKALRGFDFNRFGNDEREDLLTTFNLYFKELSKKWYAKNWKNRKSKIFPDDVELAPLTLATWYMDDGSLEVGEYGEYSAILCTENFNSDYFWKLFYKLIDIGLKPISQKVNKGSGGYRIYIGNGRFDKHNSAKKFFEIISPYVIPSMRYKLPDIELEEFNAELWNLGEAEIYYTNPIANKGELPKYHKPKYVYCLEVEDNHNFISKSMVLSNCTATNMPILMHGGRIVWADVREDFNIDPESIKERITSRTKAITVVHWGGYPCDMEEIYNIAEDNQLKVIEDCAHVWNSKYKESIIGDCEYSDYAMFSFQAIKHLTCVDGGALCLRSQHDYDRGKLLRWYGIDRESPRKDMRCLHPYTLIKLSDGGTETAANIFNNKIEDIITIKNGKIKNSKITKWFKNKRGDRYFIKLTTERSNPNKTVVTNDHKILTRNGYIKAEDLKNGDIVATCYPDATDIQRQIIIGSLLGDAGISHKGKSPRGVLTEMHSRQQENYTLLKVNHLGCLITALDYKEPQNKFPNGRIIYRTLSLPIIGEFREIFYPNGKKIIPKKLLEKEFSKLVMAIWFMDDGRTQVVNQKDGIIPYSDLALHSFEDDEIKWLSNFLSKFGYTNRCDNNRIYFDKKGTDKLLYDISPYVPNSMRYKVAHMYRDFDENLWGNWDDLECPVYYDKVIKEPFRNDYQSVYCFEVEDTHNFVCNSVVVHNCEEDIAEWGYKYHMNDVNATIGMANMDHADENTRTARENAMYYEDALSEIDGIECTQLAMDRTSSYWLFTVLVEDRTSFAHMMGSKGIAVSRVHERNDKHTCFREFRRDLPGLESIINRMICIPVGWWVSDEDREYIVDCISKGW